MPLGPSKERAVSNAPQVNAKVQELWDSASSQVPVWQVHANSRSRVRILCQYSGWVTRPRLCAAFKKLSVVSSNVNNLEAAFQNMRTCLEFYEEENRSPIYTQLFSKILYPVLSENANACTCMPSPCFFQVVLCSFVSCYPAIVENLVFKYCFSVRSREKSASPAKVLKKVSHDFIAYGIVSMKEGSNYSRLSSDST